MIDEDGYLSYAHRHADLLFEIISRRHKQKSTLITTNRPFAEWGESLPRSPAWSPSSAAYCTPRDHRQCRRAKP